MKTKETYHHGDLRQNILEEALSWIEKESIFSLSLRGIARRIGVSHNAPYRHFPDKESLLVAIAETGFKRLHQTLEYASQNSPNDDKKRVENIGIAYIEYAVKNQAYYRVMFGDLKLEDRKYPALEQTSQKAFNVLFYAIKAGKKNQVFIAEDSLKLAHICWSLVHGVSMLVIDGQLTTSDSNSILELARTATKTLSEGFVRDRL